MQLAGETFPLAQRRDDLLLLDDPGLCMPVRGDVVQQQQLADHLIVTVLEGCPVDLVRPAPFGRPQVDFTLFGAFVIGGVPCGRVERQKFVNRPPPQLFCWYRQDRGSHGVHIQDPARAVQDEHAFAHLLEDGGAGGRHRVDHIESQERDRIGNSHNSDGEERRLARTEPAGIHLVDRVSDAGQGLAEHNDGDRPTVTWRSER